MNFLPQAWLLTSWKVSSAIMLRFPAKWLDKGERYNGNSQCSRTEISVWLKCKYKLWFLRMKQQLQIQIKIQIHKKQRKKLFLRMEHHANLLWIPLASPYNTNQVKIHHHHQQYHHHHHHHHHHHLCHHYLDHDDNPWQAWLDTHFKNKDRVEVAIFKTNNVLTPTALKEVKIVMVMVMVKEDDDDDNVNDGNLQYQQRSERGEYDDGEQQR